MQELVSASTEPFVQQLFQRLGQANRDIYLVKGVGLINVHVRSEPPGWWNVLKTVKEDFDYLSEKFQLACYFVLLVGRNDRHVADGYIIKDFSSAPFVRHPGIEKTKFSINEKQHLDRSYINLSIKETAQAILKLG